MFRKNGEHKQQKMFTAIDYLPRTAKKKLEESWAAIFYREFFSRLDEEVFSVLYSAVSSRPNTPVNILVGFETLKSGFGWSDEELYERFLYDMQIRYALWLHDLDEGYFDLRTIYYFRRALVEYEKKHGINLIEEATEKITDEQIEQFQVKTKLQRMDSTQLQSNIRNMSRLQLLVEIIQRLYRLLSEEEKKKWESVFAPYIKEDSQHYCYQVKGNEVPSRLERIGYDLAFLLGELEGRYGKQEAYEHAKRVFGEHFRLEEGKIGVKEGKELTGSTLQSPDDEEATYRKKNGEAARGYVANVTETCGEENELQLVTAVSVEPNVTDDQELLAHDVARLKERSGIEEVVTDAGYAGPTAAKASEAHEVKQKTSAIKGRKKDPNKLGLEDFVFIRDEGGQIKCVVCPAGFSGEVRKGRKAGRYSVGFDAIECEQCPLREQCPASRLKKRNVFVVRFSDNDVRVAEQRHQLAEIGKEAVNIRASVESTVRSIIHPFGGHLCKMPVRGKARIKTMAILGAAMINVRRIARYVFGEAKKQESIQMAFI